MTWSQPKASSTARGYGKAHRLARVVAALGHHPADPCARCGHALGPMGPWLHFDHNDARTGYLGFSHGSRPCPVCGRRCNVSAGARKANRVPIVKAVKAVRVDRW